MPVRTPSQAPIPTPPSEPPYPWRVGLALVAAALLLGGVFYGATQVVKTSATSGQAAVAPTETAIAQAVATAAAAPTRAPAPQATTAPRTTAAARPTAAAQQQPATPESVQATLAPAAPPAPTAAPALAPTATPQIATTVPAATAQPGTTTAGAAPATSATIPAGTQAPAATSGGPAPWPIVAPELEAQVSDAYRHYWQVKANSFLALDPGPLDSVAAGNELTALRNDLENDRANGRATRMKVQNNFIVVSANDDQAQVADRLRDLSIYVDPSTQLPLPGEIEPASPEVAPEIKAIYQLQRIDGVWKVVDGGNVQ